MRETIGVKNEEKTNSDCRITETVEFLFGSFIMGTDWRFSCCSSSFRSEHDISH